MIFSGRQTVTRPSTFETWLEKTSWTDLVMALTLIFSGEGLKRQGLLYGYVGQVAKDDAAKQYVITHQESKVTS